MKCSKCGDTGELEVWEGDDADSRLITIPCDCEDEDAEDEDE